MQAREASVITPSLHCNHRQYSQNAAPPAPRHCPPAELVRKAEEAASLHEAQRSAQSQINLYVADLQAQQRQLEAAARALRRGEEGAEAADRERQALLEQLRAAEQARRSRPAAPSRTPPALLCLCKLRGSAPWSLPHLPPRCTCLAGSVQARAGAGGAAAPAGAC